jgi:hypothetical protein
MKGRQMSEKNRRASVTRWRIAILAASASLLAAGPVCGQLKFADLQKIAGDAVRNQEVSIDPPQFQVEDGMFFYELGGAKTVLDLEYGRRDPLDVAIQAQLRVEVIRTTRATNRKREYWEPILAAVEKVIQQHLAGLQDANKSERERNDLAANLSDQTEDVYKKAMEEYAKKAGLKMGIRARYSPPHTVKLVTSPPGGRIFLTHAIHMRISQGQGKDPDWRLVEDPTSVELEGKYFYLVQWGSKTVKSDRPIQIDRNGTFVLR